jgi:hypothetical protein
VARGDGAVRALLVILLMAAGCSHCTPASTVAPSCPDGSTLHTYVCPVAPGGPEWTCTDGCNEPVGTCASYGCMPSSGATPRARYTCPADADAPLACERGETVQRGTCEPYGCAVYDAGVW